MEEEKLIHSETFSTSGAFKFWIIVAGICLFFSLSAWEGAGVIERGTFCFLFILNLCFFSGLIFVQKETRNQQAYITNKHICLSYSFVWFYSNTIEVELEQIESVAVNGRSIIIRTKGGQSCKVIYADNPNEFKTIADREITKAKNRVKEDELQNISSPTPMKIDASSSTADEILKFKQLLDMGVITLEEFEEKKKQLLM